tara:strand:- start:1283 stop:1744 length:462 start_codon:yes stop_codon:yes gene_type:complete
MNILDNTPKLSKLQRKKVEGMKNKKKDNFSCDSCSNVESFTKKKESFKCPYDNNQEGFQGMSENLFSQTFNAAIITNPNNNEDIELQVSDDSGMDILTKIKSDKIPKINGITKDEEEEEEEKETRILTGFSTKVYVASLSIIGLLLVHRALKR